MADPQPAGRATIDSNAMLLRMGKFSDLILVCQGREYFVHKAIICPRSPVWAAAIEKDFQEAKIGKIEVNDTDGPTLKRALAYLYTGTYDEDATFAFDYIQEQAQCSEVEVAAGCSKAVSLLVGLSVEGSSCLKGITSILDADDPKEHDEIVINENYKGCNCTNANTGSSCSTSKLQANALLYILADYYQVDDMKQVSAEKFAAATERLCFQELADVCDLVYESTPATAINMRLPLSKAIAKHGQRLINDPSFMITITGLPELARDIFVEIVKLNRSMADDKDAALAAMAASSDAEDKAKADTASVRQEMMEIVRKVNSSERCRHCGLANNLVFEYGNSLRCTCRTRY